MSHGHLDLMPCCYDEKFVSRSLAQVQNIASKYKHRADLELVYPKSYWNKNRVAASKGDVSADGQKQRLYVDVTEEQTDSATDETVVSMKFPGVASRA